MRITFKDIVLEDRVISWRGVTKPRVVPLVDHPHAALSASAGTVRDLAKLFGVGYAIRIRRWSGKTIYWTRHQGNWSADARQVEGKLTLICFCNVNPPGFPINRSRNAVTS